jgi:type III restriction enzyme
VPDFVVVTDTDQNVVIEIKGQMTDGADAKGRAAQRWVDAVNRLGQYGRWHYLLISDPGRLGLMINDFTGASWDEGPFALT